ncbi:MAG TPA: MogA/MoaB family molybdenum cofactor biosynthesis protein [Bryobacteraceae bacterium]|nr:MogA/MoaB family molybdenum cofactor biosynthesis protein [Bryobacteraceae bacterium]
MIRVAIITISDGVTAGAREDKSGAALDARASELGWKILEKRTIPDEKLTISDTIATLANSGAVDLILSTGGTGVSPRDVTPEAVVAVADRQIPGFGEVMRSEGRKSTKFSPLSRGGGYTLGATLVVTLPGSPKGAVESLDAIADLIPHVVDLLHGRTEHAQQPSP